MAEVEQILKEGQDEFENVFSDDRRGGEEKSFDFNDVDNGQYKYLKNIGQPSVIRIDQQRSIAWYDENGRKIRVDVVTSVEPEDIEMIAKKRQYGLTIGELQKVYLYFYEDKFKKSVYVDIGHSFRTLSYPHIFGFTCGSNKRDERTYDFPVGQVVRVDNINDAELALERFSFLVEVDEGGNPFKKDIPYLKNLKQRPLKKSETPGTYYSEPEKVDFEEFRPNQPGVKPIGLETMENKSDLD